MSLLRYYVCVIIVWIVLIARFQICVVFVTGHVCVCTKIKKFQVKCLLNWINFTFLHPLVLILLIYMYSINWEKNIKTIFSVDIPCSYFDGLTELGSYIYIYIYIYIHTCLSIHCFCPGAGMVGGQTNSGWTSICLIGKTLS